MQQAVAVKEAPTVVSFPAPAAEPFLHYEMYVGWWLIQHDYNGFWHMPGNAVLLTDAEAQKARERGLPIR